MYNWHTWINETRADVLYSTYKHKLIEAGFNILDECSAMFNPYGYTVLFLLSESHLAIHTFPEHNRTYIELTSCIRDPYERFVTNHTED